MNRADHLLLNRLFGACAVIALDALIAVWLGAGQQIDWRTSATDTTASSGTSPSPFALPRMAKLAAPEPIDAETYAQVWRHNLFSTSRVADPQRGDTGDDPLSGYALTGVILSGSLHIALLTDPAGKGYSIVPGRALPHTEWTLRDVDRHEAHFEGDGRDVTLTMRKTPPPVGRPAVPGGGDRPNAGPEGTDGSNGANSGANNGANGGANAPNSPNGFDAPASSGTSSGQVSLPPLPPGV